MIIKTDRQPQLINPLKSLISSHLPECMTNGGSHQQLTALTTTYLCLLLPTARPLSRRMPFSRWSLTSTSWTFHPRIINLWKHQRGHIGFLEYKAALGIWNTFGCFHFLCYYVWTVCLTINLNSHFRKASIYCEADVSQHTMLNYVCPLWYYH